MNLPAGGATVQRRSVTIEQLQRVLRIGNRLVWQAHDHSVHAYPARRDPLFGPFLGRVRKFFQHPLQQWPVQGFFGIVRCHPSNNTRRRAESACSRYNTVTCPTIHTSSLCVRAAISAASDFLCSLNAANLILMSSWSLSA